MFVLVLFSQAAFAQSGPTDRIMQAVRSAMTPALPFPDTDASGAVPKDGSSEALWMVRPAEPGEVSFEVIANPLNEVNQLRATRAMAQIDNNIAAAQRSAAAQYDRAVAEAKRTGKSQEVDGVTLADEGIAGAKIDADSHVTIDVMFNQPSYTFEIRSGLMPNPEVLLHNLIAGSVDVVAVPSNTYRDIESDSERYAEAETIVYLGRVARPLMKKRGTTSVFEVSAAATASENATVAALVIHFRGNGVLIADLLSKTNWNSLLELLK